MVFAGVVAFGLISLFMIVYYALPGVVAVAALALYILFTLTTLKLFGATFSLAAIAGFILSVGMAVDANILVFERVKEELRHGKSLGAGIELGFRRALPAIIDSNACTILTSLVLVNVGTGPVKGFATTLIIGVLISLFTAVTVTRSLLIGLTATLGRHSACQSYAVERNWFKGIEKRADERPLAHRGQADQVVRDLRADDPRRPAVRLRLQVQRRIHRRLRGPVRDAGREPHEPADRRQSGESGLQGREREARRARRRRARRLHHRAPLGASSRMRRERHPSA